MTLTNGVSRRSIAVGGVGHWGETVGVRVGKVSWLGVSAPLAESLGAPGNEGGGGSWVSGNSGQTVSVPVVVGSSVGVGSVEVASISLGLSLVETMNGLVAGSRERSSVARGVVRSVCGVTVMTIESISLWLSISAPLAIEVAGSAAKAGGADSWSAHSGPVGVGVVESWVGSIEIPGVGLSLAGGDGDNGSSNQKFVHDDDDDTTHCGVRAVVIPM